MTAQTNHVLVIGWLREIQNQLELKFGITENRYNSYTYYLSIHDTMYL